MTTRFCLEKMEEKMYKTQKPIPHQAIKYPLHPRMFTEVKQKLIFIDPQAVPVVGLGLGLDPGQDPNHDHIPGLDLGQDPEAKFLWSITRNPKKDPEQDLSLPLLPLLQLATLER